MDRTQPRGRRAVEDSPIIEWVGPGSTDVTSGTTDDRSPADAPGEAARPAWFDRFTVVLRLKLALAASCVVVAVLAGVVYVDHHPTGMLATVTKAIDAYTAAWNAHDRAAILAAMAPGATFSASETLERPLFSYSAGPELDRLLDSLFAASVSLDTIGGVTLAGDDTSHATVPQRYRYKTHGLTIVEEGLSLFTLVTVGNTFKIAEHVWWRPRPPTSPSMLWVVAS